MFRPSPGQFDAFTQNWFMTAETSPRRSVRVKNPQRDAVTNAMKLDRLSSTTRNPIRDAAERARALEADALRRVGPAEPVDALHDGA